MVVEESRFSKIFGLIGEESYNYINTYGDIYIKFTTDAGEITSGEI